MNQPIRVLVANRPRLIRELVLGAMVEQPDIEVVMEIKNEDEIVDAVEGTQPDFLIIALNDSDDRPSLCDTLLHRHPQMKILAVAPDRNSCIFYWRSSLDIHEISVEASEAGILDALRRKSAVVGG